MNCPCGRENKYEDCCQLVHQSLTNAVTAEDLMRSRYTAFTKGMGEYLMNSQSALTRKLTQKQEIENWTNSVKWSHLEVLSVTEGGKDDETGTVEFKAHFKEGSRKKYIHEKSSFVREYGCWVYFGIVKD